MSRNEDTSIFVESEQIKYYETEHKRTEFDYMYFSERVVLSKILPLVKSLTDVGCLYGSLYEAIKPKFPHIRYRGIDIDPKGLALGKSRHPEAEFVQADVFSDDFNLAPSDLVTSFDFFYFWEDWKRLLRIYRKLSTRFFTFSAHMHLQGPTIVDPELSFSRYINTGKRVLFAQHNIFQLAAYCATEFINAKSIFVYAYHKHSRFFKNNWEHAGWYVQPMNPKDVLVGNVLVEIDNRSWDGKVTRPDLTIYVDEEVVFDSPWRKESLASTLGLDWRTSR